MSARYTLMRLELALDQDPINGRVGVDGEASHSFFGYAGLIAALQLIRAGEAACAGDPSPDGPGVPTAAIRPEGSA